MAAALTFMRKQRWGPQSKRSSSWSSGEDVQGKRMVCKPDIRVVPRPGRAGKPSIPPTHCLQRSQGSCCIVSKTVEKGND